MEYVRLEQSKPCTKCGQIKPLSEYHKHAKNRDGHAERCKPCRREDTKKYNDENAEQLRLRNRIYHHANKEARNAGRSARYWSDPELGRQKSRESYAKNIEDNRQKSRDWRKRNPEQRRVQEHTRRARKAGVYSEPYTDNDVLEMYGTNCHICLDPIDLEAPRWNIYPGWELGLHIEHVIPIVMGGEDTLKNVKPSHGICNLQKPKRPTI